MDAAATAADDFSNCRKQLHDALFQRPTSGLTTDYCTDCDTTDCFGCESSHHSCKFISVKEVKDVLLRNERHLRRLFDCHISCNEVNVPHNWNALRFQKRICGSIDDGDGVYREAKALGRTLATLIAGGVTVRSTAWRNFVDLCIQQAVDKFCDDAILPMNHDTAERYFGGDERLDFCDKQRQFCALVIRENRQLVVVNDEYTRRPYTRLKRLGSGAFGVVHAVEVSAGHYRAGDMANAENKVYAVKHIRLANGGAQTEWDVAKRFFESERKDDGIAKTLASFRFNEYVSLFLDRARCDLAQYMTETQHPTSYDSRKSFYAKIVRLAGALEFLHSELRHDGTHLKCYHLDLKPQNVLVFNEDEDSQDNSRVTFKLTDFSISIIQEGSRTHDLQNILDRRSSPQNAEMNDFGTCIPPEALGEHNSVTSAADVWSFGAVLCLFLSWMYGGHEALKAFSKLRRAPDRLDNFFLTEPLKDVPPGSHDLRAPDEVHVYKLKAQVSDWFDSISSGSRPYDGSTAITDTREQDLYRKVWHNLEESVLLRVSV